MRTKSGTILREKSQLVAIKKRVSPFGTKANGHIHTYRQHPWLGYSKNRSSYVAFTEEFQLAMQNNPRFLHNVEKEFEV